MADTTQAAPTMRMAHVGLTVTFDEFERVSDFYQHVFGWQKEREITGIYGRNQFLTDGHGSRIELIARTVVDRLPPPPEPPGHICFGVPDEEFDGVLARAREAGIDVPEPNVSTPESRGEIDARTGKPTTDGQVSRFVFLYDPSGNCLELSSGAYRSLMT